MKGKRVEVEKKRKELKADALEWGRKVDTEAKRIFGLLEPIETHLQTEENRVAQEKERIRQEKIEKEKARVAKIEKAIEDINRLGMSLVGLDSGQLEALLKEAQDCTIDEKTYGEFIDRAQQTKQAVIEAIGYALEAQKKVEAEDESFSLKFSARIQMLYEGFYTPDQDEYIGHCRVDRTSAGLYDVQSMWFQLDVC